MFPYFIHISQFFHQIDFGAIKYSGSYDGKVIRNLNNAKLTMAKEGAKGGILLAQPLSEITMLDVFLAVEPGKDLFKIHTDVTFQGQEVDDVKQKVIHHLEGAEIAMQNYLKDIRLTDLFHEERKG
ncbi:Rrf2 family transcriptional regulator [Paenibacillus sp. OK076]|uniref:RrF2 family transcriptional regulator n=1 Tax=Paenibacillus sp. OK076 TaxID=1884379 RepID=UPI0008C39903|nr:Rrf2 family transcriptional regulator [Paenibacillus sp. OK076]SEO81868.1 Transcriptional regulator [Paenibacillus sp. OK076]